jgi:hypothetical protein
MESGKTQKFNLHDHLSIIYIDYSVLAMHSIGLLVIFATRNGANPSQTTGIAILYEDMFHHVSVGSG